MDRRLLFHLSDGTPVYKGDILYHPDRYNVGWYCIAQFEPNGDKTVTVRSPNGAVPTVFISSLSKEPPIEKRCKTCGQLLPNKE